MNDGFSPAGLRTLRALKTPTAFSSFLRHAVPLGTTAWSREESCAIARRTVWRRDLSGGRGLRVAGQTSRFILDIEAEHDTDHVIGVYRRIAATGRVAKSNFNGLAFREPRLHRTLRELVMSYSTHISFVANWTLRRFSRPVNLARFDDLDWMTTDKKCLVIPEYLLTISHTSLLRP